MEKGWVYLGWGCLCKQDLGSLHGPVLKFCQSWDQILVALEKTKFCTVQKIRTKLYERISNNLDPSDICTSFPVTDIMWHEETSKNKEEIKIMWHADTSKKRKEIKIM